MARRTTVAAAAKPTIILGIDIGGTGIKGAPVDVTTGELVGERFRLETPQPATPEAVVATVAQVVKHFDWHGPIGVGFPAVVKYGTVSTAANIDKSWIGLDAAAMIAEATGCSPVAIGNDADVAGLAEATFGEDFGDHAELRGALFHGVISDEVRNQVHALFRHQPGAGIVDQIAVFDGADAEPRGAGDGFRRIGMGADIASEGGRLLYRRADLAVGELLAVERVIG